MNISNATFGSTDVPYAIPSWNELSDELQTFWKKFFMGDKLVDDDRFEVSYDDRARAASAGVMWAIEKKNGSSIALLLAAGIIPVAEYDGLLVLASQLGMMYATKALLENTDLDLKKNGSSAFQHSCKNGFAMQVKVFLKDERIDPTISNGWVLFDAAHRGHRGVVRALLEDGRIDPNLAMSNEYTDWDGEVLETSELSSRIAVLFEHDGRLSV